jgi:hypothetical protein
MANAWLLARALDVDLLLYLEDDVQPCVNAIPYAIAAGVPDDLAFVTYFPTVGQVPDVWPGSDAARAEFDRFPVMRRLSASHYFAGNQFLAIPRQTIDFLVQNDPLTSTPAWHFPNGADAWMGSLLSPQIYGAHLPALVEHVGDHSAAHPGLHLGAPNRRAACWPGPDFDAMTLLGRPGRPAAASL